MPKLVWDNSGQHFYEAGLDRGVFYPLSGDGVVWNGLTAVDMKPSGGQTQSYYIDGLKYALIPGPEEFVATLRAFTYPDQFAECDGTARVHSGLFATQQPRKMFGLSYRTRVGNELNAEYGYRIHLVYNALAAPSDEEHTTLGDSVDTVEFEWDLTTLPPSMTGYKPTAHLVIDTRSSNPAAIVDVENILYGTDEAAARLPGLAELITIFDTYAILSVVDNGDGTFTVTGPDDAITMPDANTFQITWPSAVPIDADTFTISSL